MAGLPHSKAGQQILALNRSDPRPPALKFDREYSPEPAQGNSLILIGSRQSTPRSGLFSGKLNFEPAPLRGEVIAFRIDRETNLR
jgi:hypothetical protein